MDQELYDEFGNYIGPEMADSDEEGSSEEEEADDDEEEREQQGPAGPEVRLQFYGHFGFVINVAIQFALVEDLYLH
jgi:hypothetical protein